VKHFTPFATIMSYYVGGISPSSGSLEITRRLEQLVDRAQAAFSEELDMNILIQYAAKFVCGKSDGSVVAPGDYWTSINVHNPARNEVHFQKKIAIALPSEKAGPVSQFFKARLGPDEALEIDRADIFEHSLPQESFLKGFVVIESEMELDVVAVYTAAGNDGAMRSSK
jgi:hypothetical protein